MYRKNNGGLAVEVSHIPSHWEINIFPAKVVGIPSYLV